MAPLCSNTRIVEPCLALRHRAARGSGIARCIPATSSVDTLVKEPKSANSTAAKEPESIEHPYNETAITPRVANDETTVDLQTAIDTIPTSLDKASEALSDKDEAASDPVGGLLSAATRGMLLLNLGAALFGSNQVIIKTSEELMSPTALNAARFAAAAACFIPLIPRALKSVPIPSALELGIWLTLGYTFQAYGLSLTSASHGAFTGAFTVLTVPVLIGLSGREVGRTVWFSAAVALFGISLLTGDGGNPNYGDLFCVASAIFFGVHKWRGEAIVSTVSDAKALVALQLAFLGLCSVGLAVPEMVDSVNTLGVDGSLEAAKALPWAEICFMGIGTTALTLYIEMEALKDVSAATAALIYTSEPIWGAFFAWVLLGERWGAQGWVGAGLVVGASVFSQVSGESEKLKYDPDAVAKSNSQG